MNLLVNYDWTKGFTTIADRGNMRVPKDWYFSFIEGLEPRLPKQSSGSPWLAPEMTFRSADGLRHGQTDTEQLPGEEVDLYLAPDSPVVYHVFKGWGIQWWRLGINGNFQALDYKFSVELFNDVYYSRNQQKVAPEDALAMEWRVRLGGDTSVDNFSTSAEGFRKWNKVERTFTHRGGILDVSIEVRARWGVDVVGAFLRRPSLVALNLPTGNDLPPDKYALLTKKLIAVGYQASILEDEIASLRLAVQGTQSELSRIVNTDP